MLRWARVHIGSADLRQNSFAYAGPFSAPALLRTARLSRDAHPGLAIKASPGTARSRLGPGRYRALGLVSPRFTCRWIGVLGRLSKHLRCSPSDDEVVAIHV